MSTQQEKQGDYSPEEREEEEGLPVQQPTARERAERAAAAAQARARGEQLPPSAQDEKHQELESSTMPIVQPSQEATASAAQTIATSTGVQVDSATAALAAATMATNPAIGNDMAKALADQLECCEWLYNRILLIKSR
jgi:hypothetical protein